MSSCVVLMRRKPREWIAIEGAKTPLLTLSCAVLCMEMEVCISVICGEIDVSLHKTAAKFAASSNKLSFYKVVSLLGLHSFLSRFLKKPLLRRGFIKLFIILNDFIRNTQTS